MTQLPLSAGDTRTIWTLGSSVTRDGTTLVRTRGELTACLSVVTTIGDGFDELAVGICVVTDKAFAAGAASIPGPLQDLSWDGWLWHQLFSSFRGFATTETGRGPMEAVRLAIDSKAMRKLKESDVIVGCVETGAEIGAATLLFTADTRMLLKIP